MEFDYADLVARYVAVWNEPDDEIRRRAVEGLWIMDGVHVTPLQRYRGHKAIEGRVRTAYFKWVVEGGCRFEATGLIDAHHEGLRFHWRMRRNETTVSVGFDFVFLSEIGEIVHDHQYVEPAVVAAFVDTLRG